MATDANQKVLPLAFAVVDKESGASWGWFLECLRNSIGHVIPNEGICIIYDRHKGIKCAIAEWPLGDDGKLQDVEINALRRVDPDDPHLERYMPYTYLMSEDVEKWTQSHDGGRRYGAMTTNISECFNGVLKGARGLPIAAMVEFTWCKLVAYFHDRHKQITSDRSQGKVWSDYAMGIYNTNLQKTSGHTVREFNHETGVYQVVTPYNDHRGGGGNHSHEVRVFARTCGCGKWQNIKIPCSHAIKVLQQLHLNATSYIDPCYSLENVIHTYSHQFVVPMSESLWRDVRGPRRAEARFWNGIVRGSYSYLRYGQQVLGNYVDYVVST
ncbi:uncharacterized protein LOC142634881 [Castanea sativa]|uniref:uncharacterized protein LOC142634881 n=1 Tax=Castanea sativa TaxID=21020 RepID=UPI003F653EAB